MFFNVALGKQYCFALRLFCDDAPPRVDDRRMAMGFPRAWMGAALRRSQQVALGFDCAGAYQHLPMCRACHGSEGRWGSDQFRAGLAQCAVQLRKAQVVAHAKPQPPNWRVSHHHLGAIGVVIRLTVPTAIVATSTSNRCSLS